MPLDELEQWLQARAERRPIATCIAMLDGYVTAIVAGPVSISPPNWICPLLAIDADAFDHGGTPEFAAISAVVQRHNEISNVLSTAPHRFAPMHSRKPNGDVDLRKILRGVVRNPRLLRALVSTGIDFNRALKSLRGCRGFLLGGDSFIPADL